MVSQSGGTYSATKGYSSYGTSSNQAESNEALSTSIDTVIQGNKYAKIKNISITVRPNAVAAWSHPVSSIIIPLE